MGGGGLRSTSTGGVVLEGVTNFTFNTALKSGGAMELAGPSTSTLISSKLEGNSAGVTGGAIAATGAAIVSVVECQMVSNTAADGGAFALSLQATGNVQVITKTGHDQGTVFRGTIIYLGLE